MARSLIPGTGGDHDGRFLHPAGAYHVVCIDVIDLGMKQTKFGPKHKVAIRFTAGLREEEEGKLLFVQEQFTMSMNQKAHLRKFVEQWAGQRFTEQQAKTFDLERLVANGALVNLVHEDSADGERTYCNIGAIMPPQNPDEVPVLPSDYDREPWPGEEPKPAVGGPDVPFAGGHEPTPGPEQFGMDDPPEDVPAPAGPHDPEDDLPF